MIRLDHVTFGYGPQKEVLRDISLEIPEGGRLCLTGPSGEGKTTVLRLLLGLEKPRRGTVSVPEGTAFSAVFQSDSLDAMPDTLSGGMKRRVALARALAHPFDVLVLDEALTGLDGGTKTQCLAAIDQAVGRRTLVMATHDESEAAALGAEIHQI